MKNPNIAEMLRYYRKLNKYTVKDVSEILISNDVKAAEKTIYSWELGTTQPSADTLMMLCDIYNVPNVLETFGYSNSKRDYDFTCTENEVELLKQYRNHPEMHNAIHQLLDLPYESKNDSKNK